jgi:hypothetical protein
MTMMKLTIADIAPEYAPYNTMAGFHRGWLDYQAGRDAAPSEGVEGQAYDRGFECAMRVQLHNHWIANNVGLD